MKTCSILIAIGLLFTLLTACVGNLSTPSPTNNGTYPYPETMLPATLTPTLWEVHGEVLVSSDKPEFFPRLNLKCSILHASIILPVCLSPNMDIAPATPVPFLTALRSKLVSVCGGACGFSLLILLVPFVGAVSANDRESLEILSTTG